MCKVTTEAELLFETIRDFNSVRHHLQSHFLEKLIDRGRHPAVFRVIESLLNVPYGFVVHVLTCFRVIDASLGGGLGRDFGNEHPQRL